MRFNLRLLGVLLCIGLTQCGDSGKSQKPPEVRSQQACGEIGLFKDMGLEGAYLKNLLHCASVETKDGQSFGGILQLVDALDAKGLDQLIAFLLQDPVHEYEGRYPYLSLLAVMLDRGLVEAPEGGAFLNSDERFGALQQFLAALDPYRAALMVLDWQSTPSQEGEAPDTKLDLMLDHLQDFLEGLAPRTVNGLTYSVLFDQSFRSDLVEASMGILKDEGFYDALSQSLTIEESRKVGRLHRPGCLSSWVDPVPAGSKDQADCQGAGSLQTGATRYGDLVVALGQGRLKSILTDIIETYEGTAPSLRVERLRKVFYGARDLLKDQNSPLRTMTYATHFLAHTKLEELDLLLDEKGFLGDLLLQNLTTLRALGLKVGHVALHDHLSEWLLVGGAVPACENFALPRGLNQILQETDSPKPLFALLEQALKPNDGCPRSLPPILVKAATFGDCLDTCFAEVKPSDLNGLSLLDVSEWQVDHGLLGQALQTALDDVRAELERDAFALWHLDLAGGAVSLSQWDRWAGAIQERLSKLGSSPRSLAIIDLYLTRDHPEAREILHEGFLEGLISRMIHKLNRISYEFQGLFPDHEGLDDAERLERSQLAVSRILAGIYEDGPLADILKQQANVEAWDPVIGQDLQGLNHGPQRLIAGYGDATSSFISPVLTNEVKSFAYQGDTDLWDGLIFRGRRVSLKADVGSPAFLDFAKFRSNPFDYGRYLSWVDNPLRVRGPSYIFESAQPLSDGFGLPFGQDGLWQKLSMEACQKELACPYHPSRFKALVAPQKGPGLSRLARFFDGQPLNDKDMRILLWYYARHYGMPIHYAPEGALASAKVGSAFSLKNAFLNTPLGYDYLTKTPWPMMYRHQPSLVHGGKLSGLVDALDVSNLKEVMYENQLRQDPLSFVRERSSESSFSGLNEAQKLFMALDLMTMSGKSTKSLLSPVIGYQGETSSEQCLLGNDQVPSSCAITVAGASEADARRAYTQYVSDVVAAQLCPYLSPLHLQSQVAPATSIEFRRWLQSLTGIDDAAEFCSRDIIRGILSFNKMNQQDPANPPALAQTPGWVFERIIKDVVALGQRPKLRQGLALAPAAMRFYRAKLTEGSAGEWLDSSVILSSRASAWHQTLTVDSDLLDYQPSLVDHYLANVALIGPEGIDKKSWDQLVMASIDVSEEGFEQTALIQYFKDNLLGVNKASGKERSLLTFLVEQVHYLTSDDPKAAEALRSIVRLLAKPQDSQSMNLYALFNSALTGGYGQFLGDRVLDSWQGYKSLEAFKMVLRPENFRGVSRLMSRFSTDEIHDGFMWVGRLLRLMGDTPKDQADFLVTVVGSIHDGLFAWIPDGFLLNQWDHQLKQLAFRGPSLVNAAQLDRVFQKLQEEGPSFGGASAPALMKPDTPNFSHMMNFLVDPAGGLAVVGDYQRHDGGDERFHLATSSYFFRDMSYGILKPFGEKAPVVALGEFLKEPIWGLTQNQFLLEPLLMTEHGRDMLSTTLETTSMVVAPVWQAALKGSQEVLPAMEYWLRLANRKIVFADPKEAIDYQRLMDAMLRMSSGDGLLLKQQVDAISPWFEEQKIDWDQINHGNKL